jgi:DNA-binding transcriptional MerR regulator
VYRIGDFSRIARVSCRLLRYYDEIGLLKPATVERDSGYRSYSADQLPQLNRILVLKELGLSLEEIGRIVARTVSADELRGMLLMRRTEIERSMAAEAGRLRQIETRIAQVEADGQLSVDDVVVRAEPAHRLLSVRQTVESFAAARTLIGKVVEATRRLERRKALGTLVALAHSPEFEADSIDLEVGYVLNGAYEDDARVPWMSERELPAVAQMAACVRVGLPEHAHLVTTKIGRFVAANGYRLAGPSREVFLQPPQLDHMEKSVVEMQFPVEKSG